MRKSLLQSKLHIYFDESISLLAQFLADWARMGVEEEFVEETEAIIPQAGSYFIQVYTGNCVVGGEFEVE